jgi:hypothetical protein
MKNEKLYDQYAIDGWPCHFFSMAAVDKYNKKIEKFCNELPEGATELTESQETRRMGYVILLSGFYDIVMAKVEDWQYKHSKKTAK